MFTMPILIFLVAAALSIALTLIPKLVRLLCNLVKEPVRTVAKVI